MGSFNTTTLLPCPPEYSDYEAINAGTLAVPQSGISLNNFYRSDYIFSGAYEAYYSLSLTIGKKYRFAVEGNYTQSSFDFDAVSISYWSPTDWGGAATATISALDAAPLWCPYSSELNRNLGVVTGGFRVAFVATETGTWRFYVFYTQPV